MVKTSYGDTPTLMPNVELPEPYATDFRDAFTVWQNSRSRNAVKRAYHEGENRLKNIGIAIPPELECLSVIVGWPKKAVRVLANKSRFDGFHSTAGTEDLAEVVSSNMLKRKYRQLARSELIHGLSTVTVTHGLDGEPDVRVRAYSAVNSAIVWDYLLERAKCGLTVHDVDTTGIPTRYVLYESDCIIEVFRKKNNHWYFSKQEHIMGRPPIEPLVYDGDTDYPLGHSRISKAVMDITDRAVRESLRTELASEFSATPQKYLLGGYREEMEAATQGKTKWEMYIGNIQWFTKDKDGETPQFGQLPQVSMQPHVDYRAALAAEFAAETSVPIEMLGIQSKTYTSSDSARASLEELVQAAEDMNDDNSDALEVIARMALAVKRNVPYAEVDDDIIPAFKNPARPSLVSQADSMVKIVSAIPWIAETSVALEELGFTDDQRRRMESERRRAEALRRIEQMQQAAQPEKSSEPEDSNDDLTAQEKGNEELHDAV